MNGEQTSAYYVQHHLEHLSFNLKTLSFSGEGSFSGRVYPEGYYGVANFGNSSPNIMDMGWRDEATIATFVIPGTATLTVATNVSVITGDGHPDQETYTVESFSMTI